MYCLHSQKGLLAGEENRDHTAGVDSTKSAYVERWEREQQAPKGHIVPSDCKEKIATIRSYEHPSGAFPGGSKRIQNTHHSNIWKGLGPTLVEEDEIEESRFQTELERAHRNMHKNRGPSKRSAEAIPYSILGDCFGRMIDQEWMDASQGAAEARSECDSRQQLWSEASSLKKELRRAHRLLDSEREENARLQDVIQDLNNQVDVLDDAQQSTFAGNQNNAIHDLQRQVVKYQRRLEEEQKKNILIQTELECVKKESQIYKDNLHVLLFQHGLSEPQKFQDIGPCTPKVVESSSKIASYDLGTILGEGHYGKVAVGADCVTKKQFAIKLLKKRKINRFQDLQQVAMEVHVLRKYPHENIVKLQEVIHTPANIYLVMELCSMDLHKYLNERGLSEHESQQIVFGILRPLHHLHSHGISHLDLKPENILLAANFDVNKIFHSNVRICDFGLVSIARNPTKSKDVYRQGYVCGTPGFFAPEMILKQIFEGRQADMWSLGCIILEITLGFTQEWIESYDLIKKSPSAFRLGIERCLEEIAPMHYPRHAKLMDIIHRCLTIEVSKRIPSSEAIEHSWLETVQNHDEGLQEYAHSLLGTTSEKSLAKLYSERTELISW